MMFKQLIAIALVAMVAANDDPEPKAPTFEETIKKLPSIHFEAKPGPLMPGLYKLILGDKAE